MSLQGPLLVDTDDRAADRKSPVDELIQAWSDALRLRTNGDRKTIASSRLAWIERTVADLASDCPARQSRAARDLHRANLTAAAVPVLTGWLQRVATTGEVHA